MTDRTRWGTVAALVIAGVIVALQIGKAAIAVPVLQRELSLTLVVAAWMIGAYGMMAAVFGLSAGILSSLFSARRALLFGLVTAGIGSLAGAMATNGAFLIATRVVEGAGFLAAVLALPRLINSVTAPKDRDVVFAFWAAYMPLGSVIMMVAGPHLMTFGWQTLWIVNGVIVLAYAALIVFLRLDQEQLPAQGPRSTVWPNIRAVLGTPGPALLALAFGIYTFQYSSIANLLPTLLVDRMGLSVAAAGAISAITVAANAVGNIFAGALARMGVPLWALATFGFSFVAVASFGIFSDQVPVIVIAVLASACLAITGVIPASIFAAAPRVAKSSALLAIVLGLTNQVSNIGNLVGPAVTGTVAQTFGWESAPFLFTGMMSLGLIVALLLRKVMRDAKS